MYEATPKFQPQPPLTKNIAEGQDLSVPCTAVGPPTPNVKWVQIVGDVTKSTGTGSATLRIPNIRRDQNGTYECQASNNPNERPVTAQTVVTVYYPPQTTLTTASITVVQGHVIVLSCTADGYPPPSILWTKTDGVIKDGHTVAGGTLRIPDAIKTDAGQYICTAKNTYDLREYTDNATATVVVKYQPSILLDKLQNQIRTFNESDSLTLKCDADGYPSPTIKWKTPTGSVHTGKVLDILSVNRSDAGTYICMAYNGIGREVNASIQVTIQYKPDIDEADSSSTSKSWNGNSVRLRCFATGLPAPRISWYKPTNQQITTGVNIVPRGSEVTVLTTADQGDYGQYKCRATNILGRDEHVIDVTQLFPPGPVTITLAELEASSGTVRWTKPADDGGSPVIDYKVEINSTKATVNKLNFNAVITKLNQNTRYLVKVSARNVVGYGNVSEKVFYTLKQGPPGVPELIAMVNDTNGLSVRLTWTKPDDNGGEITQYTIYMKKDGDSDWIKLDDVTDPSILEYKITKNIEYGKRYQFIVSAWNKYGESKKDELLAKTIAIPVYKTTANPPTSACMDGNGNINSRTSEGEKSKNSTAIIGVIATLFVISLVVNVLLVSYIWKKVRVNDDREETNNKRKSYPCTEEEQTYENAFEMRNKSLSPGLESADSKQITDRVPEYEAVQPKKAYPQNNIKVSANSGPYQTTSIAEPSHYQELTSIGAAGVDNTRPVYEPLRSAVPRFDNQSNTYQPLGLKNESTEYQSLHTNGKDYNV